MTITLYTTTADTRQLTKTLGNALEVNDVLLKEATAVLSPKVELTRTPPNVAQYNYVYIPTLGRYYYINEITSLLGGRTEMQLEVDVLMSHREQILSLEVIAKRSASKGDCYIRDDTISSETRPSISTYKVSDGLFYPHLLGLDSRCFVVTVLSASSKEE